jgi:hypothetical protein
VKLDRFDPFLERNLARLEIRFRGRLEDSLKKKTVREEQGKPPHKTVLQSIEENRERLEVVKLIREKVLIG